MTAISERLSLRQHTSLQTHAILVTLRRRLSILSIWVSTLLLSGCGTIIDCTGDPQDARLGLDGPHLLGGVRTDALILHHPKESSLAIFSYLLVLDFPFSLAFDLLLTPYTVPKTLIFDSSSYQLSNGTVIVKIAPPQDKPEVPPNPLGPDQVWTPGEWEWSGETFVWTPGQVRTKPRPDAVWLPGRWERLYDGWIRVNGHWSNYR